MSAEPVEKDLNYDIAIAKADDPVMPGRRDFLHTESWA